MARGVQTRTAGAAGWREVECQHWPGLVPKRRRAGGATGCGTTARTTPGRRGEQRDELGLLDASDASVATTRFPAFGRLASPLHSSPLRSPLLAHRATTYAKWHGWTRLTRSKPRHRTCAPPVLCTPPCGPNLQRCCCSSAPLVSAPIRDHACCTKDYSSFPSPRPCCQSRAPQLHQPSCPQAAHIRPHSEPW
jgi:hypothetical protein